MYFNLEIFFTVINCGNPDAAANVKRIRITNGFDYGSSVEFACETNYILEGSKIIICGETKEWSSTAPSCLGEYNYYKRILIVHFTVA